METFEIVVIHLRYYFSLLISEEISKNLNVMRVPFLATWSFNDFLLLSKKPRGPPIEANQPPAYLAIGSNVLRTYPPK
jgi:hypothetical protein